MNVDFPSELIALKLAADLAREAFHQHKEPVGASVEERVVFDVGRATLRDETTRTRLAYEAALNKAKKAT